MRKSPKQRITVEDSRLWRSLVVQDLKRDICEVGRRMWQRSYVDANAGNIGVRIGPDRALCTPTLISKGFMAPGDLCMVDMEGRQIAGARERTSEMLMHLDIMKRQPKAVATVHCHPPYGTAFSIARVAPPKGLLAEYESVMSVGVAPYCTPGTPELGRAVAELAVRNNVILMSNHGVVAWSSVGVEDAYFKIEILEAYCHMLEILAQIGSPGKRLSAKQLQPLTDFKRKLGIPLG